MDRPLRTRKPFRGNAAEQRVALQGQAETDTSDAEIRRAARLDPALGARLRDRRTNDNRLLLRVDMESGHGGASGRYRQYRESAEEYAFIIDLAGIER